MWQKVRSIWVGSLKGADIILMVLSPLAILMVIVGVIVLMDRGSEHDRFVRSMREDGQVIEGIISGLDREDEIIFVHTTSQGEDSYWLLYTKYYPEALDLLDEGQKVRIRYLPPGYEAEVIWEDHFDAFEGYRGYALDVGVMLLAAWLIVVIHPEFLYIGYLDVLPDLKGWSRA